MLKHLPNSLTLLRLALALPLGIAIAREQFGLALAIGLIAGLSDFLDGFLARRLQAFTQLGALLDPIADKAVITACFACFAMVGLIPWYLAAAVIVRDVVIVGGAACYWRLYGPPEFAASSLSKANMALQIGFCLLVLITQVVTGISPMAVTLMGWLVLALAVISGVDYVITWSGRALQAARKTPEQEKQ